MFELICVALALLIIFVIHRCFKSGRIYAEYGWAYRFEDTLRFYRAIAGLMLTVFCLLLVAVVSSLDLKIGDSHEGSRQRAPKRQGPCGIDIFQLHQ